jgi:hypothetical protein
MGKSKMKFTDIILFILNFVSKYKCQNIELEEALSEVNLRMREPGVSTQLSPEFLDQYSKITNEIKDLEAQNDSYLKLNELNDKKRRAKQALDQNIESILLEIETQINNKMEDFNDELYDEKRKAPVLKFKAYNSYSFYTPDDDGTGTNYKGMVLFDLAALSLTKLPAIAYDSLIFKNIEDESIDGIMQIYADSKKQIFISFDRASSYNTNISTIVYDNTRLELGTDGHELYGMNWKSKENNNSSR